MPPVESPAAPAAPAGDAKTPAANIAKGIQDKANGKATDGAKAGDGKGAPAADPNAGKRKLVVDGKEYFVDEKQLVGYAQKGIAFEPRISELARLQNETAAFLQTLKDSPEKVLFDKRIGHTPESALKRILASAKISDEIKEEVGQWYWHNVAKVAKMAPEERALMEKDAKIKEYEDEKQRTASEAIARENQQRVQAMLAQVKGQIAEAMKEIGLPSMDTPIGVQLAKRVADVMRLSYLARRPCTPKEAAAKVRGEIKEYQKSFYDVLDDDKLVEELGKENAEKVRKHFLKVMKETEKAEKKAGDAPPPKRGERSVITPDQMHDYLQEVKRNNRV